MFLSLHSLTWLVIIIGIAGIATLQQNALGGTVHCGNPSGHSVDYGWPMEAVTRGSYFCNSPFAKSSDGWDIRYELRPLGILVNFTVGAVFVFLTAFSTEHWVRSKSKWQFSFSSIFVLCFVVLATLATIEYVGQFFAVSLEGMLQRRGSFRAKFEEIELPWYFQAAVVFSLAWVFHTVTLIIVSVIKRLR